MTNFLQLLTALVIILSAAKIAGHISVKFGQPSVFGELLIGIILGPSLVNLTNLPFISDMHLIDTIDEMAEIGVLLLMFLAGIELHLRELAHSSRVAMFSGSLGVIFPILLGFLGGILLGMESRIALFVGLTLAATSVSISAQTLMELGYLKTRVGFGLLGAAVYDDILVILLLSIFVASMQGAFSAVSILLLILRMGIFFTLAAAFGYFILPKLVKRISATSSGQGMITFALVLLFIYGLSAELIGNMAAITGTFFAGLFFSRTMEKEQITAGIQNLAYGFFVPIFFVSIGLKTNLRLFSLESFGFLIVMLLVAVTSKVLGSGLGARIGGLSWAESYQLGNGMVSRGEVGLIVASIGANSGLITSTVLTDIVIIILISTLITPILLKKSFTNPPGIFILKEKQVSTIEPVNPEEVE